MAFAASAYIAAMKDTLGTEIRRLRLAADTTLREFARRVGISAAHLSDIENGRRMPSEKVLHDITKALAHVGASYEALKQYDSRLGTELEAWVQETPQAGQLLRAVKDSGRPIHEILRELQRKQKKVDEDG